MKYILLIMDGAADEQLEQLGGKTPLSYEAPEELAIVARQGRCGLVQTIPQGCQAGTDAALLTVFGADARNVSRGYLEACGSGLKLDPAEEVVRCNLVCIEEGKLTSYCGGGLTDEEARTLYADLVADQEFLRYMEKLGIRLLPHQGGFRGLIAARGKVPQCIPPHEHLGEAYYEHLPYEWAQMLIYAAQFLDAHEVNSGRRSRGLPAANMLWPWGGGGRPKVQNFSQRYGKKGCCITAVSVVEGVARLAGLEMLKVPGATGDLNTDWQAKGRAAIAALEGGMDFAMVHLEAPDECAHMKNIPGKVRAVRMAGQLTKMLLDSMQKGDRLLLLSDHYTSSRTGGHLSWPTTFGLYEAGKPLGPAGVFDEKTCAASGWMIPGKELLPLLFEG